MRVFDADSRRARMKDRIRAYSLPLLLVLLLAVPFLGLGSGMVSLCSTLLIYVMLGWGLNITVGQAGLLDFGFAAWYAVGAYVVAILCRDTGVPVLLSLPLAGVLAALGACVIGAPVLRLKGDYFAVVTLALGEIMRQLLVNLQDFTGGPSGINGLETAFLPENLLETVAGWMGSARTARIAVTWWLILLCVILCGWFCKRIRRLPLGRAWEAVREDEIAARSLGLNITRIKISAYGCAAFWGGIAGGLFTIKQKAISPESFGYLESVTILAMIVVGGMGRLSGVVLGVLIVIGLPEMLRDFAEYRMLVFGFLLVSLMILRPAGLMGKRLPAIEAAS